MSKLQARQLTQDDLQPVVAFLRSRKFDRQRMQKVRLGGRRALALEAELTRPGCR